MRIHMENLKYFHTYITYVKLRWKNKPIIDVLSNEFKTRPREYYLDALDVEAITVNNKKVHPEYKLKDLDIIRHTTHIHEPMQPDIEIIAQNDDFWVVNKPFGIPCHPTGGYFKYSITKTLFNDGRSVGCVNRLDMPVSGVLIISINNADQIHKLLDTAKKIYVAKVKGYFPDYVEVDKPIGTGENRIHEITENGKPSKTIFNRISYMNGMSLVQCQPITGRTHQIRIHLKYLGFPIINDILYGGAEIPNKAQTIMNTCDETVPETENKKYEFIIKNCKGTGSRTFLTKDLFICLHAWKYVFGDETYEAKWPFWTKLD